MAWLQTLRHLFSPIPANPAGPPVPTTTGHHQPTHDAGFARHMPQLCQGGEPTTRVVAVPSQLDTGLCNNQRSQGGTCRFPNTPAATFSGGHSTGHWPIPIGALKAVATPTDTPAVTKSRLSFGLRKRLNSPVLNLCVRGGGGGSDAVRHAADTPRRGDAAWSEPHRPPAHHITPLRVFAFCQGGGGGGRRGQSLPGFHHHASQDTYACEYDFNDPHDLYITYCHMKTFVCEYVPGGRMFGVLASDRLSEDFWFWCRTSDRPPKAQPFGGPWA